MTQGALIRAFFVILSKQILSSPLFKNRVRPLQMEKKEGDHLFCPIFFIFSSFLQAKPKGSVLRRIISKKTN
jgi:hypothetical protein